MNLSELKEKKYTPDNDNKILDFWYESDGICKKHLAINNHPLGIYYKELDEFDAWFHELGVKTLKWPSIKEIKNRLDRSIPTEVWYWLPEVGAIRTPENLQYISLEPKTYFTEYFFAPEYTDSLEERDRKQNLALPIIKELNEKYKSNPSVIFGLLMPS